ncbi:MAG: molybdopterin-guanine dinucleotide biosynthesis protein A [Parasphingorhabdus sp.]
MYSEFNRNCTAVILCGGQGRRLGGQDKGLALLQGRSLVDHVISRIKPQVAELVINANRNLHEYSQLGYTVVADQNQNYDGPLSGMLAAMQHCSTEFLVCVPCDAPQLPIDLVDRFSNLNLGELDIACVHDGERLQPTFSLLRCSIVNRLSAYLESGERKIDRFYQHCRFATIDYSDHPSAFINLNRPEDFDRIENSQVD